MLHINQLLFTIDELSSEHDRIGHGKVETSSVTIGCFQFNFRENQTQSMYGNIMYDRRIVRGNTYAQNVLPVVSHSIYHYQIIWSYVIIIFF